MKKIIFLTLALLVLSGLVLVISYSSSISGAPPYGVADDPPTESEMSSYDIIRNWARPEGPAKVALQVGHLNSNELPDELQKLRDNTGASGGGFDEVDVNQNIADLTKEILEENGIRVEILPATIPPKYWADAFVAIHADGNLDPYKIGYKAASPRRDFTGGANLLRDLVEEEYEKATGLVRDPVVTRNMRGYYAFGWWRYEHALHPMTTAIILETGFLSSPSDRTVIVNQPELSAQGLASGIILYLESKNLLP